MCIWRFWRSKSKDFAALVMEPVLEEQRNTHVYTGYMYIIDTYFTHFIWNLPILSRKSFKDLYSVKQQSFMIFKKYLE